MLLSMRELVVWTGLGPFEVSVHSLALCVFTLLITLRVGAIISSSWHIIFIPLYTGLAINLYYNIVLYMRMSVYSWKRHPKKFLVYIIAMNALGLGLLLFAEVSIANFLDGNSPSARALMVTSITLLLGYLLVRMLLVFRTLKRSFS